MKAVTNYGVPILCEECRTQVEVRKGVNGFDDRTEQYLYCPKCKVGNWV